ncbi:MAG TPA: ferritin family protein [candidate division Zixibacteria bacterium]
MQKEDVLEILKRGIKTEIDGFQLYKMASEKTKDPKAKDVFKLLAEDELKHEKMLREQYKKFKENGKFKFEKKDKGSKLDTVSSYPIFSENFRGKLLKEQSFEMSALSIGIMLEQNSIDFYKNSSEKIGDLDAKALFNFLAEWEGEHLKALVNQQRVLQEDFWTEARFYPF